MNSKTLFYILKRVVLAFFTFLIVVTITFWVMQLVPGGPWTSEKAKSEIVIATLNAKYGLDKPLYIQYLNYLKSSIVFDFGYSYKEKGRLVIDIIMNGFKTSFVIGAIAAFIALILGTFLGTMAAIKQNKIFDRIVMVLTTASVAMPSFVICLLLLYIFAVELKVLPTTPVGSNGIAPYILPVVAEALYPTAYITRLMRSSTLDVLSQDYIRTAKAKGVKEDKILIKHAVRNSITPVITYFGPMFASIITGSLVVESIFQIPGVGNEFYKSIVNRNYPMIMGTTCLLAALLIVFTLISDITYKIVNPRVDFD